jgi:hypothetical protein
MASRHASIWRALLPALLVLVLAVGWSGYWFWLSGAARHLFDGEKRRLADRGVTVQCGEENWGGFPFRMEFDCAQAHFASANDGLIARAETGNLLAVMQAYDFRRVAALIDGPTTVTPRDGAPVILEHQRILAAFHRLGDGENRLSIEIPTLRIADLGSATIANIHLRNRGVDTLDIAASGDGIQVAHEEAKITLDNMAIEASLPLSLFQTSDPLRRAAETGATLTITRASITRGALIISGEGNFTVTPQGHLDGTLKTVVNDLDQFIQALKETLPLDEREIQQLSALGGVLAGAGASKSFAADLIVKDGSIYWSAFKLGEVPPLF